MQIRDLESSLACGAGGFLRGISDKGPDLQQWLEYHLYFIVDSFFIEVLYSVRRDEILAAVNSDRRNWLNAPWIVAEFYFYRRIVEAFKFFETGYDMFAKQKQVRRTNYFWEFYR